MLSIKQILFAALAVSMASAADVCDQDFSIDSDGDVANIASCSKLSGNINVGKNVVQVILPTTLTRIAGDLVVDGAAGIVTLQAAGLKTIDGSFTLKGLTVLTKLSFPSLVNVGDISWATLPVLAALDFTKQVSKANTVLITDTYLGSLTGINLDTCQRFNINNNKYLKTVDVALANVTDLLIVEANGKASGKGVDVSFPDLVWANNITIRDASSASFPKLEEVKSSASFINNTLTDLAFPELTTIGESLAFISNEKLSNVTANNLKSVGGTFQIANNTGLDIVEGFASLATIGGAVDLSGTFTDVELPSLDDVRGGFNLQSTQNVSCSAFNELKGNVVKGDDFTCEGEKERADSKTSGLGTVGDGSEGGKTSGSGAIGVSMLVSALACAIGMMAL